MFFSTTTEIVENITTCSTIIVWMWTMMAENKDVQFSWNPTLDGMPEELIISVFHNCPTIELLRLAMTNKKFFRLVKSPLLDLVRFSIKEILKQTKKKNYLIILRSGK